MENLSPVKLGVTFCGCFLGAALVSGQELWQFFGGFGIWGFAGLGLAMVLFFASGVLIFRTATKSGTVEFDCLIIPWNIPWLRRAIGGITTFFMYGILVIMAAGADALVTDYLGAPPMLGAGILCLLVVIVALVGLKGMVAVFECLVPILTLCTVVIAVIALAKFGFPTTFPVAEKENSLLSIWWLSAISYVTYNAICSVGLLAPLSRGATRKTAYLGTALGTFLLFVLAGSIMLAMASCPSVALAELPMLDLALLLNPVVAWVYGLLLFGGMFGAGQGCAVAVVTYMELKFPKLKKKRAVLVIAMGITSWLFSGLGFGALVGTVYPIFGYVGMGAVAALILHAVQVRKN